MQINKYADNMQNKIQNNVSNMLNMKKYMTNNMHKMCQNM